MVLYIFFDIINADINLQGVCGADCRVYLLLMVLS